MLLIFTHKYYDSPRTSRFAGKELKVLALVMGGTHTEAARVIASSQLHDVKLVAARDLTLIMMSQVSKLATEFLQELKVQAQYANLNEDQVKLQIIRKLQHLHNITSNYENKDNYTTKVCPQPRHRGRCCYRFSFNAMSFVLK